VISLINKYNLTSSVLVLRQVECCAQGRASEEVSEQGECTLPAELHSALRSGKGICGVL